MQNTVCYGGCCGFIFCVCLFNLAMKERHREIARGKQRREEFKYVTQKGRI